MDVSLGAMNKSRSSVSPSKIMSEKKNDERVIYTERYQALEEDEIS